MRYFVKIAYNGILFSGSQIQEQTPTVQLALNKALSVLLNQPVMSFGASRTDKDVHALGNFYHFDSSKTLTSQFPYQLNAVLPEGVSVEGFFYSEYENANARFSAESRSYRYKIYFKKNPFLKDRAFFFPFNLDKEALRTTADIIKEYRQFESFAKRNSQNHTFDCSIFESLWEDHGQELHYIVKANRFLRGMVRALVGTQLRVARRKITVNDFREIIEQKDCTLADFSVAGHGLYLESVDYPQGFLKHIY